MERMEIAGPVWENHCKHSTEDYVCSFWLSNSTAGNWQEKYDLYVYKGSYAPQDTCIRYGNAGEDYYSVGPVTGLFTSSMTIYDEAKRLLLAKGQFLWIKELTK